MTAHRLQLVITLSLAGILPAMAQATSAASHSVDATWTKMYATSCGSAMHHCLPSPNGYENEFNGDPRLPGLLRDALPQGESWWVDGHAGSARVSGIVQEFIGVPGNFVLDDDRYVTATGCVPHDCTTNGMLWIDTGTQPASVIFVAEVMIEDIRARDTNHLWLYTSSDQNFEALPPNFLTNLKRWHGSIATRESPQSVTVATLVQPDGRMQDLTWDTLFYKQNQPQPPASGVQK